MAKLTSACLAMDLSHHCTSRCALDCDVFPHTWAAGQRTIDDRAVSLSPCRRYGIYTLDQKLKQGKKDRCIFSPGGTLRSWWDYCSRRWRHCVVLLQPSSHSSRLFNRTGCQQTNNVLGMSSTCTCRWDPLQALFLMYVIWVVPLHTAFPVRSQCRHCRSAAPPCHSGRCFNSTGEGVSAF